jgi:hypothetical protein
MKFDRPDITIENVLKIDKSYKMITGQFYTLHVGLLST